jgi:hypothetical protein
MNPEILRTQNAKIYLTKINCFGTVVKVSPEVITVNTGTKKEPRNNRYEVYEFDEMVRTREIVPKSEVEFDDNGNFVGLKTPIQEITQQPKVVPQESPKIIVDKLTEIGYINEKTGKFSKEKKRGYTQIRYEKVKQKITIELDEEKIEELRKLGVL